MLAFLPDCLLLPLSLTPLGLNLPPLQSLREMVIARSLARLGSHRSSLRYSLERLLRTLLGQALGTLMDLARIIALLC